MESQRIGRRDVLKRAGATGAVGILAAVAVPQVAQGDEGEGDESSRSLLGSWRETIDAGEASYSRRSSPSTAAVGSSLPPRSTRR
jgi:hypothetical protein